jgi:hypothetical protein
VTSKFSLMRSVLCCHLLTSCEKLTKLFLAYDTLGVSIISRIGPPPSLALLTGGAGFLSSCEVCWRAVALAQATTEYHPTVQELLWLAKAATAAGSPEVRPSPPSLLALCCDVHGPGQFFLADLCCVRCEEVFRAREQEDVGGEEDQHE